MEVEIIARRTVGGNWIADSIRTTIEPSTSGSVFVWSLVTLSVGVRYGPVCRTVIVFKFQPPRIPPTTGEEFNH